MAVEGDVLSVGVSVRRRRPVWPVCGTGGIGECAIKSGNASGRGNYEWNGIGCRRAIDPGYSVLLPDGQHHPPAYITGGC